MTTPSKKTMKAAATKVVSARKAVSAMKTNKPATAVSVDDDVKMADAAEAEDAKTPAKKPTALQRRLSARASASKDVESKQDEAELAAPASIDEDAEKPAPVARRSSKKRRHSNDDDAAPAVAAAAAEAAESAPAAAAEAGPSRR